MAFEIKVFYHPRKEEGGYDTAAREESVLKVGSGFDDTPLEKLAGVVMAQLARRDVWVVDVEIQELVKRPVSFKESKDGKGIVLKNKRFSVNSAAQMVCEDVTEVVPQQIPEGMQPHELMRLAQQQQTALVVQPHQAAQSADDLYANPNKPVPVQRNPQNRLAVNQNKVLYKVVFDPPVLWQPEAKRMGYKFTQDREYPVHQIVQHPSGKLSMQKIVVTDDHGRAIEIDEKYFTAAGTGMWLDKELGFSGSNGGPRTRKPTLAFENEMFSDGDPRAAGAGAGRVIPSGIPVDDGTIPADALKMPELRRAK